MIWLQKVAVPNIQFRIARCSALIVRMCCNCDRPIRFHTRLNLPNVCSLRTPESIWTHFCVPNSRGRHPASLQSKKSWKCPSVLYVRCWIAGLRCTWRRTRRNFWHNRQPGTLVYASWGLQSMFGRARCQIVPIPGLFLPITPRRSLLAMGRPSRMLCTALQKQINQYLKVGWILLLLW